MQDIPIKTCLIWYPFSLACGIKGLELLGLGLSIVHCQLGLVRGWITAQNPARKGNAYYILHTEY